MQRLIENLSLFLLIAVAMLRPLVAETYDSAGSSITAALEGIGEPSPLRTLTFDLLILCGATGWTMARALGHARRYRRTGLEWGLALLVIAAVASCLFAGNKRLAINATVDWLCLPLLTIALVQLMRQPWQRRLLLAAVLASAVVQAFQCAEQHFAGFDETLAHYESIKADFWARQGVDLDSAKVDAFERRIKAREASGFLPHSNVTASYLALCGLAAMGLTLDRWRRAVDGVGRALAGVSAVLTAALFGALALTESLGATIAAAAAVILWLLLYIGREWIDRHRRRAWAIGWTVAGAGLLAIAAYGLARDALPGWSLTFRWQYWTASSDLIADHPLTGVGRENFGRHYLAYKEITSPEEVSNPHNLLIQAAAEWGVFGLAGILLMLVAVTRVLCLSPPPDRPPSAHSPDAKRPLWPWVLGLLAVLILGRLPLLGSDDPNYLYYASTTAAIVWLIGFCVFGLSRQQGFRPAVPASAYARTGVAMGLLAFVVHDLINFAAFVPGSATTGFALLAFAVADRAEDPPDSELIRRPFPWLALGTSVVVLLAMASMCLVPVARTRHHLKQARRAAGEAVAGPLAAHTATRQFHAAMQADPLDPTPCVEKARWLAAVAAVPQVRREALQLAADALVEAVRRDPHNAGLRRLQMRLLLQRAQLTDDPQLYQEAINAGHAALQRYPQSPGGIVALADCKLQAGEATGTREWLVEAIADYQRALALDAQRLAWEELYGFRDKQRHEIRTKIQRAQRQVSKRP